MRSRVQAENLVLEYARDRGLPAVAMCVSTTYGAGDWGRTPHGAIIAGAAFGKLPFVMGGIELEAVGVDDAARAMILAADKGRVGERYLISEKMISNADVVRIAAEAAGVPAPTRSMPLAVSYAMAALGSAKARLTGTDEQLSLDSLRLMRAEAPVDCSKAKRELGWQPRPVEESIREAARSGSACARPSARASKRADPRPARLQASTHGRNSLLQFGFGDDAAGHQRMREGDQLVLRVGQFGVHRRRQRVLLVAALLETRRRRVTGGVVERVAEAVEAGLPRRHGILDAVLRRHPRPHLIAVDDLLQGVDGRRPPAGVGSSSRSLLPVGCIAARVAVMTLVVTPAFGSATPIRQSRVMISIS